jgi:allophanate hydrolase subunit 1
VNALFIVIFRNNATMEYPPRGVVAVGEQVSCPLIWETATGFQLFGVCVGPSVGSDVLKRKVLAILKPF